MSYISQNILYVVIIWKNGTHVCRALACVTCEETVRVLSTRKDFNTQVCKE